MHQLAADRFPTSAHGTRGTGPTGSSTIGVHTPEFSFERNLDNVRRALEHMRVTYPVVVDNDYGVWNAFANHYWPALYFVDAEGRIRHHQFGEGDYERSEMVIQQLLGDAGADVSGADLVSVDPSGPEMAADWGALNTGETYLGYRQPRTSRHPVGWSETHRRTTRRRSASVTTTGRSPVSGP